MKRSLRKCKINSSDKLKILLDTTYLLPIIGIDVERVKEVLILLKRLHNEGKAEYYYTPFNILEILGKLSRIKYDEKRVSLGLISIGETFELTYPTIEGYVKALKLRSKGYKDLIDLLLYTTSISRKLLFLTRDYELLEFLRKQGEEIGYIVFENDFIKMYGS